MPQVMSFAIFDPETQTFKGKGGSGYAGPRWTNIPVETYKTESKARAALTDHQYYAVRRTGSMAMERALRAVVIPVTLSW